MAQVPAPPTWASTADVAAALQASVPLRAHTERFSCPCLRF